MSTYTKATLLEMNTKYGYNWILNLENINDRELAILLPTENINYTAGRLYVALPAKLVLTDFYIKKYNILK